jgi:hypothetical protein
VFADKLDFVYAEFGVGDPDGVDLGDEVGFGVEGAVGVSYAGFCLILE